MKCHSSCSGSSTHPWTGRTFRPRGIGRTPSTSLDSFRRSCLPGTRRSGCKHFRRYRCYRWPWEGSNKRLSADCRYRPCDTGRGQCTRRAWCRCTPPKRRRQRRCTRCRRCKPCRSGPTDSSTARLQGHRFPSHDTGPLGRRPRSSPRRTPPLGSCRFACKRCRRCTPCRSPRWGSSTDPWRAARPGDMALVLRGAGHRASADTCSCLAGVRLRASVAVVARGAIRRCGIRTLAVRGATSARHVALVLRRAGHRVRHPRIPQVD